MKWGKEPQLGWRTVYEQNLITNRIRVVWEIPYFIDVVMKFMWNMALNTSNYYIRKNFFVDYLFSFFSSFIFQKFISMGYASNYLISGVLLKFKDFVKHVNVIVTVIAYYQFQRCSQCLNDVCCSWDTHTFFGRGMDALKNHLKEGLKFLLMIGPLVKRGRGKIKNLTQKKPFAGVLPNRCF